MEALPPVLLKALAHHGPQAISADQIILTVKRKNPSAGLPEMGFAWKA
jgi:hypothetical protein